MMSPFEFAEVPFAAIQKQLKFFVSGS